MFPGEEKYAGREPNYFEPIRIFVTIGINLCLTDQSVETIDANGIGALFLIDVRKKLNAGIAKRRQNPENGDGLNSGEFTYVQFLD